MGLDERHFFNDKPETRTGKYQCPKCHRTNDYSIRWVRRAKKDRLPPNADETDRAKFAKLRDYLLRLDEDLVCKTCGKKFEIPSQHSLVFLDQLAGLPNEADLEREIQEASGETEAEPEAKPALPARFTRKSSGWK
jgi:hypothetical protein